MATRRPARQLPELDVLTAPRVIRMRRGTVVGVAVVLALVVFTVGGIPFLVAWGEEIDSGTLSWTVWQVAAAGWLAVLTMGSLACFVWLVHRGAPRLEIDDAGVRRVPSGQSLAWHDVSSLGVRTERGTRGVSLVAPELRSRTGEGGLVLSEAALVRTPIRKLGTRRTLRDLAVLEVWARAHDVPVSPQLDEAVACLTGARPWWDRVVGWGTFLPADRAVGAAGPGGDGIGGQETAH